MKLTFSQPVLRKILTVYLTHKEQLTAHEQELAIRICSCTLCEHLWVRRIKRIPSRCPKCARTSWNRPLIESLRAIDDAKNYEPPNKPHGAS
jgi:predicted Zn-ribbon and HTH transcriptional regulator